MFSSSDSSSLMDGWRLGDKDSPWSEGASALTSLFILNRARFPYLGVSDSAPARRELLSWMKKDVKVGLKGSTERKTIGGFLGQE